MNDNQNNYNNQNGSNGEKEEIRFDERDFNNPYSQYYSERKKEENNGANTNGCDWNPYTDGNDNPYSNHYEEKKEAPFNSELAEESKHRNLRRIC